MRQVGAVLLAFLLGAVCSALLLVFLIPAGYAHVSAWTRFVQLIVLSLIGPTLAGAVPGPDGLGVLELLIRIGVPVLVLGILVQGYFRRRSVRALLIAAAIWSLVGGFVAFVAATGSI
ncbi:MAG: hypothetical protein IT357_07485 [Gemmatimonadaceae bacterium]|nr:hypothetical protein [Gemmatimonadaceae bacterium]